MANGLPDFSKARVTVVGDYALDRWFYGRMERISPEAPVPIFVKDVAEQTLGMAGNVVENLKALGCQTLFLHSRARPCEKERYFVSGQQVWRADRDFGHVPDDDEIAAILRNLKPCDVLVLSDYGKGIFGGILARRLIEWAIAAGSKVVVDPKSKDWSKYRGADVVTPNLKEWFDVISPFDGIGAILLTRGAEGMSLLQPSRDRLDIPATNKNAIDVCGAGDTVVAALAACLAVGVDLETAARIANAAAGVVVGKRGTATCSRAELEAALLCG